MTQECLNRQVAEATGEDLRVIARHGFVPLSSIPFEQDEEACIGPSVIDWDQLDLERNFALFAQR